MPNQNSNQIITAAHITTTSSPIPPADEMERYNQINPSIVKEIMRIYADNSNHNRKQETHLLGFQDLRSWRMSSSVS